MSTTMDDVRRIRLEVREELSRMTPEEAKRALKESAAEFARRINEVRLNHLSMGGAHETT